jgi:hypothetical protein
MVRSRASASEGVPTIVGCGNSGGSGGRDGGKASAVGQAVWSRQQPERREASLARAQPAGGCACGHTLTRRRNGDHTAGVPTTWDGVKGRLSPLYAPWPECSQSRLRWQPHVNAWEGRRPGRSQCYGFKPDRSQWKAQWPDGSHEALDGPVWPASLRELWSRARAAANGRMRQPPTRMRDKYKHT